MTEKELRTQLVALRDKMLELNEHFIRAVDESEYLQNKLDGMELYEFHNELHAIIEIFPYENMLASILAQKEIK